MAERVTTGGLKTFSYGKGEKPKLDEERKKNIDEAYEKYYERKKREKKARIIKIVAGILLAIIFLIFVIILINY